jgi:hypothetical protein
VGALSTWLPAGLALLSLAIGDPQTPAWQHALALVGLPVCGALGGALRGQRVHGREHGHA